MATISGAFLDTDLASIYGTPDPVSHPDSLAINDLLLAKYDIDTGTPVDPDTLTGFDSPEALAIVGTLHNATTTITYDSLTDKQQAAETAAAKLKDAFWTYTNGDQTVAVVNQVTATSVASKTFTLDSTFDDAVLTAHAGAKALVGNDQANILGGNDFANVITGNAGDDTIFAAGGNDTINYNLVTDGSDSIYSGAGQDKLNLSSTGSTVIGVALDSTQVGDGSAYVGDTVSGGLAVALQAEDGPTTNIGHIDDEGVTIVAGTGLTLDVQDTSDSGNSLGDQFTQIMLGTSGKDIFIGSAGNDYINGGGGIDNITGGAGNDYIDGGGGNDTITDTSGANTILGGAGNDIITAGVTVFKLGQINDQNVDAGLGNNKVTTGSGNDTILGGDGRDTINGGSGNDIIDGKEGNDGILGGTGNDTINGGVGRDTIDGGTGNDLLMGDAGNDTIIGGAGNDTILGGAGSDYLTGGTGVDMFVINGATDGTGIDIISDFGTTTTKVGAVTTTTSDTLEIQGHDSNSDGFFTSADFEASAFPDPTVKGVFISFDDGGSVLLKNVALGDLVFTDNHDGTGTFSLDKGHGNITDAGS